MRSIAVATGVLLALVGLTTACRKDSAPALVTLGRGRVQDTSAVRVSAVTAAALATDYDGNPVPAGTGSKCVLLDCVISAPPGEIDLSDFQLVRERVSELGAESNLGENGDSVYFYWSYLDQTGGRLAAAPDSVGPLADRLAFKVPAGVQSGYLFYWGLYWDPSTVPAVAWP